MKNLEVICQPAVLICEKRKGPGRPPQNGIVAMPKIEVQARYRQRIKDAGGNSYTVRIKSSVAMDALLKLVKLSGFKSETAALTCFVENKLLELLEKN